MPTMGNVIKKILPVMLAALVLVSGCSSAPAPSQPAPDQPSPQQSALTAEQVQAVRAGIDEVEQHWSALKDQYATQGQRFDKMAWGAWSATWNQERNALQARIDELPQASSAQFLGVAVRELIFLRQEYDNDLEGRKTDAAFFEKSIADWLASARAELPQP